MNRSGASVRTGRIVNSGIEGVQLAAEADPVAVALVSESPAKLRADEQVHPGLGPL
jgi:hypothetical protein